MPIAKGPTKSPWWKGCFLDMLTQQILEEKKFWEDRIGQVARFREYFFVVKQGG
jgi:hypothetical protein